MAITITAIVCGTAFYLGRPIATEMFTALACGTAVTALTRRRLL